MYVFAQHDVQTRDLYKQYVRCTREMRKTNTDTKPRVHPKCKAIYDEYARHIGYVVAMNSTE